MVEAQTHEVGAENTCRLGMSLTGIDFSSFVRDDFGAADCL